MKKFAAGIPRKMFWSDDVGSTQVCPECGGKLERERHTYAMALREGSTVESLIVGNDAGYFCSQCPLVVLDRDVMEQYGMAVADHPDRMEFMVMGIVDVDAVPQEKANFALGGENNPVPLVAFTNISPRNSPGS